MPLDIALAWDPVNRRCDVVYNGVDFVLDSTWQTPVLMCLGNDRRAHPDDPLPQPYETLPDNAPLMNLKRGWPGDALDPNGDLTGSRAWIYFRSKLDAKIAAKISDTDKEALAPIMKLGVSITIAAERIGPNTLARRVQVGKQTYVIPQVVGL